MQDMTRGEIGKKILRFTLPLLLGNLFQQLYNMVDSIVVGQFVGKEAIAAVGVSFPIMFLIIALVMGATMGTTVLVSQFFGAKNFEMLKKTISTAYIFLFIFSFVIMITGVFTTPLILKILSTPSDVFTRAKTYMLIIFLGIPLLFGYNSLAAILRGLGDSKTPLYLLIISTFVNIGLDLLFVIVFKLDVGGAALATVIAQGISFFLGFFFLSKRNELFNLKNKLIFDWEIFKKSVSIGLPSGIQQIMVGVGAMLLTKIVNGFGTDVLAAFTAVTKIDAFATVPALNFGMAISTFVGQNLGAGKIERIKEGVKSTLLMTLFISMTTSIIIVLFPEFLISLFNRDKVVINLGSEYLRIVGFFYFTFAVMFVFNGVLRGAGDTIIPMFATVVSQFLLRVPAASLLSKIWGTKGIWWGMPIAWGAGMAFSFAYYKTGKWKKRKIGFKDIEKVDIMEELEKF